MLDHNEPHDADWCGLCCPKARFADVRALLRPGKWYVPPEDRPGYNPQETLDSAGKATVS